jgi:hypothetical protein
MNTDCTEIQRMIWTDGPAAAPASHLQGCASCSEQTRRAGDLQAALLGLGNREVDVPPHLHGSIVAAVSRTRLDRARGIVQHPKFWRGAAVGAAAAATAVAGLIVARKLVGRPELEVEPSLVA